ncbi:lamin tail domain-containing protein, partial [bacterium]|nr:lamin tail domain-containing protein [bacterium]
MRPENNVIFSSCKAGYPEQSVIINEIMYRPDPNQCEWVELYNPGGKVVNLIHWQLWDKTFSRAAEINSDFFIKSGGFGIIAADSVFFTNIGAESMPVYVPERFPTLNNNYDQIILKDFSGLTCDSVLYYDVWGGGNAVSLERVSAYLNPYQAKAWQASADPAGATPGRTNSCHVDAGVELDTLFYEPQPLSFGSNLQVSGRLINLGEDVSPTMTLLFFNNTIGDSVLSVPVSSETVAALAPGESIDFQVNLSASQGGIRWLFLGIMATGKIWGPFSFAAGEAADVIGINEFMAAPRSGEPEWIELFNRSQTAVVINGWTVQGESKELPIQDHSAFLIPPHGYLIVTGDADFRDYWPNCDCPIMNMGSAFPNLQNT